MIRFFRRRKPRPTEEPPRLSVPDALTAHHAGLTYWQWTELTDAERSELRWRVRA